MKRKDIIFNRFRKKNSTNVIKEMERIIRKVDKCGSKHNQR